MRKEALILGFAVAGSLSSCSRETATPGPGREIPATQVGPGDCEYIKEDFRICNYSFPNDPSTGAGVFRLSRRGRDSIWLQYPPFRMNLGSFVIFDRGDLDGLALEFDTLGNLYFHVEEPLLSATPVPTLPPPPIFILPQYNA